MRSSHVKLRVAVVLASLVVPASSQGGPVTPEGEPLYSLRADPQPEYLPVAVGLREPTGPGALATASDAPAAARETSAATGAPLSESGRAAFSALALACAALGLGAAVVRRIGAANRSPKGGL